MYEIRLRKKELRDKYSQLRRQLDASYKLRSDNKICDLVLSLASYRFADAVLMYAPKPEEVNVMRIAEKALSDGKTVAFPRCNKENTTMKYLIVTSLDQLEVGAYGLLEPPIDFPELAIGDGTAHALCIIPALLYDKEGYRLGYGKGYYDRCLAQFKGTKLGVAYSGFVCDKVPRGRFDLSADVLVTEKGVRSFYEG